MRIAVHAVPYRREVECSRKVVSGRRETIRSPFNARDLQFKPSSVLRETLVVPLLMAVRQ